MQKGKLTKHLIDTKHFEGVVDITDPCYSKTVWCRMETTVRNGEYDCVIWCDEEGTVAIIGIYQDGIVPSQQLMKEIGEIGVDAGLAGFFMNKPDYTDEQWSEFCDSVRYGNAWIRDEGFFSCSGDGDGCYPVYAHKLKDGAQALEIRFF